MTHQDFSLSTAQDLLNSNEPFPVNLDLAWQWLGYVEKRNAVDTLKSYFEEGLDFLSLGTKSITGGRPSHSYSLTVDCFKEMGMLAKTEKGKEIRRYFLECEKIAKQVNNLSPLLAEIQSMKAQLSEFSVNQLQVSVLQAEKDELLKDQLTFLEAAQEHPGCANILTSDEEDELTTKEYLTVKGIDLKYMRTIAKRATTMQRVGTGDSPKTKRNGQYLLKLQYLKEATKSVLGLD